MTSRSDRAALWLFIAYLLAAVPILVVGIGSDRWFSQDEWYFFDGRSINARDLTAPYFGHLVALPIIAWRLTFRLVGLHAYWPYQLQVVSLHLVACALLRLVMRRSGVGPWPATIVAGTLVLFGSGATNILSAFQISFMGSFVFGLTQLLLTDSDDPVIARRDVVALLAGFAAVSCSSVGVGMVGLVGLAVWLRRGWKPAALQVLPPAIMIGTWYVTMRSRQLPVGAPDSTPEGNILEVAARIAGWNLHALRAALEGFGLSNWGLTVPTAIGLGALVLIGCWASWQHRQSRPLPLVLVVGALMFMTLAAAGRGRYPAEYAAVPRYVYVVGALLLPAMALGFQKLVEQRRALWVPLLLLIALGVPANIGGFEDEDDYADIKARVLAVAASPHLKSADPSLTLLPSPFLPGPSVGWIAEAKRAGDLPEGGPVSPELQSWTDRYLAIQQSDRARPYLNCELGSTYLGVVMEPSKGDVIGVRVLDENGKEPARAQIRLTLLTADDEPRPAGQRVFELNDGHRFEFVGDGLRLRLISSEGLVEVCRG